MINTTSPEIIYFLVLSGSFSITLILGYIMQRTNFCTMGAISDYFLMGSLTRARQWILAIAVSVMGVGALRYFKMVVLEDSIYVAPKVLWLSVLVGSLMFGVGMVFASGCAGRNLMRVGSGSIRALVVVVVAGVFAQMTLRGVFAVIRVKTVDQVFFTLPSNQDVLSILDYQFGLGPLVIFLFTIVLGSVIIAWVFSEKKFWTLENCLIGLFVGFCIISFWWLVGNFAFLEEDPNTLEKAYLATNSNRLEMVSFVAPIAYLLDYLTLFSDASKKLTLGIVSIFGMMSGSFLAVQLHQDWRWQGFTGLPDLSRHLIGAALMGVGGVTALGCTFGQGLSGISTLSISSMIAIAGFIGGAYLALKYLEKNN
jgi:uncharacterized protein